MLVAYLYIYALRATMREWKKSVPRLHFASAVYCCACARQCRFFFNLFWPSFALDTRNISDRGELITHRDATSFCSFPSFFTPFFRAKQMDLFISQLYCKVFNGYKAVLYGCCLFSKYTFSVTTTVSEYNYR